jgi:phage-related protein
LRNTTRARDADIRSVEDWILKTSLAVGVADDQLRPAFGQLARATGDMTEAQDLLSKALDISAATGIDVETVSKDLAKAHNGVTRGLLKYGVAIKRADGTSMSFDETLAALDKRFKGSAATAANTAEGQFKRLGVQFNEVKESIGQALIPVVTKLGQAFLSLVGWVQRNADLLRVLGLALAPIVAGLVAMMIVQKVSAAVAVFNAVLAANPIGLVVIAIAALVTGLVIAYKKVGWFRAFVDGSFRAVKAAFTAMAEGFRWAWQNIVQPVWNAAQTAIRIYLTPLRLAFEGLQTVFQGVVWGIRKAWENILRPVFDAVRRAAGLVGSAFRTMKDGVAAAWNGVLSVVRTVWNSIADLWNSSVGKISIHVPSWVPGVGGKGFDMPNLPRLAEGALVMKPTLALVGEAGPEAVVPLSRMRDSNRPAGNMTVTVNVTAPPGADQTYIRWLSDQILRAARDGGPLATAIRQVV